jgi:glutathione S-transferase
MDLYYGRMSGNSARAVFGLTEAGVPYRAHVVDTKAGENKSPAYLAVNPMGKIPALADGDFKLWESNAINWYAAEKSSPAHLLPASPEGRADVQRWLFFQSAHVSPACIPVFRAINPWRENSLSPTSRTRRISRSSPREDSSSRPGCAPGSTSCSRALPGARRRKPFLAEPPYLAAQMTFANRSYLQVRDEQGNEGWIGADTVK